MTDPGLNADTGLSRRVLLSTISNYGAKVITLAVWFFLTPYMVRQLGATEYGLWALIGSVVAYGSLLDFGIAPAVTKYVAEYSAKGQAEQMRDLVVTALWLYAGLGLLAIVASAILAPVFPKLFILPAEQHEMARWLVLLSGIGLGLALPATTISAVLQGLHRFDLANLLSILGTLLFTATTIIVLALGWGLIGIMAVNIPLTLVTQLPALWLVHRAAPQLKFGLGRPKRELVRTVFSFSAALVVVNVADQIQTQTDEIVIGTALPVASITPYAIARRLSGTPQILTRQFVKVLMPLASGMNAVADGHQLRSLYLTSARLTLALAAPLVCGLIALGGPFLAIWVGPQYAAAAPLVVILSVAGVLDICMWPAFSILQGMGRHRPIAFIAIGSALANLLLSIWLVHPLGVAGVALGTLIPTSIECIFFVTPYVMRVNGVSLRDVLTKFLGPSLLPALPMLLTLYALRELLHPATYLAIGAIGFVGIAIYGMLYLALIRGKPEWSLVHRFTVGALSVMRKVTRWAAGDTGVAK